MKRSNNNMRDIFRKNKSDELLAEVQWGLDISPDKWTQTQLIIMFRWLTWDGDEKIPSTQNN